MELYICILILGLVTMNQGAWLNEIDNEPDPPQFDEGTAIQQKMAELLAERSNDDEDEPPEFSEGKLIEKKGTYLHEFFPCFVGRQEVKIQIRTESLFSHNTAKKRHYNDEDYEDLVWNETLAESAQVHADAMAKVQRMYHSSGSGYGENVAFSGICLKDKKDVIIGPANMAYNWYGEIKYYDFTTHGPKDDSKEIGHFTQMVWKNTRSLGCGLASAHNGTWHKTYYACQYYPPGNVKHAFADNVPYPIDGVIGDILPQDLNVAGCCDYSTVCKRYKRYCSKYKQLEFICGISCNSCKT